MLEGLNKVDWRRLRHSYGSAIDLPDYIRDLASTEELVRERAYSRLLTRINHQQTDIGSATAQTVPFLLELMTYKAVPAKDRLLRTLIGLVYSCNSHMNYFRSMGDLHHEISTYQNVCTGLKIYLNLLQDNDDLVRHSAAQLLGLLCDQRKPILRRLRKAVEIEPNPYVLAEIIYSLGKLLVPWSWRPAVRAVRRNYSKYFEVIAASDSRRAVRLAAASAWVVMHKVGYELDRVTGFNELPKQFSEILTQALIHPLRQSRKMFSSVIWEFTVIGHLSKLGIHQLAKVLSVSGLDGIKAHLIGREMMDKVFTRRSIEQQSFDLAMNHYILWNIYEDFNRNSEGMERVYRYPEPLGGILKDQAESLNTDQKFVLTTIVNNDLFWSLPTNLFSFFYGLPDSREELCKLIDS